jgi:uncharacterized membrane protein YdbT with pleckstrin-like domain
LAVDLVEGEHEVWRGRPSWRSMLVFYLWGGLFALVPGVAGQILNSNGDLSDGWAVLCWIVTLVLLVLVVLVGWLRRIGTVYVVTDRRIHIRQGILGRREHSTSHERIQNVNTDQGLLERMLGIGDVDFDTAGTDDYDFTFFGVRDPSALVRLVAGIEAPPPSRQGL